MGVRQKYGKVGVEIGVGGGPHDWGMDPWQASVENRLGQLHEDVRGVRTRIDGVSSELGGKIYRNFKLNWTGIMALGFGVGAVWGAYSASSRRSTAALFFAGQVSPLFRLSGLSG
jgi:hypothetical protein